MTLASLLVPALRWDSTDGFEHQRPAIEAALGAGAGGFVLFGGSRAAVTELIAELHERSKIPLLIAAEVERGAGQQFEGCVSLPPFGALGFFENPAAMRRAGLITARDLKRAGANWALAPVCNLDFAPGDPAIGTRAAGDDPARVGALTAEWIDGCQSEGVMACAKHFPGQDLTPFHSGVDAGVASVMTAAATFSPPALSILRERMEFDGLIAGDAPGAHGTIAAGPEHEIAVHAIVAGCDVLLTASDVTGVTRALDTAAQRGAISAERARDALQRRDRWALWARPGAGREPSLDDEIWSRQVADASVHLVRGAMPRVGSAVEIVLVDDDAAGASPVPSRAVFAGALRELEIEANVLEVGSAGTRVPVLIAAFSDPAAGKSAPGFSGEARDRVKRVLEVSREQKRDTLVVLFSHPRHAAHFPGAPNVLCAWGGESPMQAAAARVIARASR